MIIQRFLHTTIPPLILLVLTLTASADPVDQIGQDRFAITVDGDTVRVPLVTNEDVHETHLNRDRVTMFVPDGTRRAVTTGTVLRNACYAYGALPTTMITGPQFLLLQDYVIFEDELEDDIAFWTSQNWTYGQPSDSTAEHPREATASSFTILDSLIATVWENNPHFEAITLFGESAGGKFMMRYLVGTRLYDLYPEIPLYVVSVNCGDFLYVTEERPGLQDNYAVPSAQIQDWVPKFNAWPYGLDDLHVNAYMTETGADVIAGRYEFKDIFLLVGGNDHLINSDDKPMHMQGMTNLIRNVFYDQYLAYLYGDLPYHTVTVYPGLSHDGHDVTQHPDSWPPIFDHVPQVVSVPDGSSHPGDPALPPPTVEVRTHPNPVNGQATVRVALPQPGPLDVAVFNELGQRVATLTPAADRFASGVHEFSWDSRGRASGVYFVRAITGDAATAVTTRLAVVK